MSDVQSFAGLLLIGDYDGNIQTVPLLHIKQNEIKLGEILDLLMGNDKITVAQFYVLTCSNCMYVVCVKSDYLLVYLFNKNGQILDNCIFQVGNLDITAVEKVNSNTLLVGTISGVLKEIQFNSSKSNKLHLTWRHIYVNINWAIKRVHGFAFSKNRVLFCILTYPCKMKIKKDEKSLIALMFFENCSQNPLKLLMENKTNSIYNYWDCFEVLRITNLMNKGSFCIQLPSLDKLDELSISMLKTYVHFSRIGEVVYKQDLVDNDSNKLHSMLRCMLTVVLITCRMKWLLELQWSGKINKFQFQNLSVLNNCLKDTILYENNIQLIEGSKQSKLVMDVMEAANKLEYEEMSVCTYCNNNILLLEISINSIIDFDASCLPEHFENRCAISMMPLDNNALYKCPFCKIRAHVKLQEEVDVPFCPYCDIAMDLQLTETVTSVS